MFSVPSADKTMYVLLHVSGDLPYLIRQLLLLPSLLHLSCTVSERAVYCILSCSDEDHCMKPVCFGCLALYLAIFLKKQPTKILKKIKIKKTPYN